MEVRSIVVEILLVMVVFHPQKILLGFSEPAFWEIWLNATFNIFYTSHMWTEIVPSFMYSFSVDSFTIHLWPYSLQIVVSVSVWSGEWTYFTKLSESYQAPSREIMTPNFPWLEKEKRISQRKLYRNRPPRSRELTINSYIIYVLNFSFRFCQPYTNTVW